MTRQIFRLTRSRISESVNKLFWIQQRTKLRPAFKRVHHCHQRRVSHCGNALTEGFTEQAAFFPQDDSKKFRLSTKKQAVTDCSIQGGQRLLRKRWVMASISCMSSNHHHLFLPLPLHNPAAASPTRVQRSPHSLCLSPRWTLDWPKGPQDTQPPLITLYCTGPNRTAPSWPIGVNKVVATGRSGKNRNNMFRSSGQEGRQI